MKPEELVSPAGTPVEDDVLDELREIVGDEKPDDDEEEDEA